MEPWQLIVALIQGLVEWLPISSEGQVVLFVYSIGTVPYTELLALAIWLHLGTTMAVIVRYPRDILDLLVLRDRAVLRQLVIATIATAAVAIPLYLLLRSVISATVGESLNVLVGALLVVTGLMLYLSERKERTKDSQPPETEPSDRKMLLAGVVQGFSVLPGLSRSGLTVSALLMQRVDKTAALRLSFLMSVPAVLGIVGLEALIRLAARISFWRLCIVLGMIAVVFGLPALF